MGNTCKLFIKKFCSLTMVKCCKPNILQQYGLCPNLDHLWDISENHVIQNKSWNQNILCVRLFRITLNKSKRMIGIILAHRLPNIHLRYCSVTLTKIEKNWSSFIKWNTICGIPWGNCGIIRDNNFLITSQKFLLLVPGCSDLW